MCTNAHAQSQKRVPCGWGFEQSYCAKLNTDGFRSTARWACGYAFEYQEAAQVPPAPRGRFGSLAPPAPDPRWVRSCPLLSQLLRFPLTILPNVAVLCCSPVASDWTLTTVKAETASPVFPSPSAACRWDACAELCENPGLPLPRSSSPAYPMLGSLISDAVLPSPAGPALVPRGHKCARMKGQALFILIVASP